MKAVLTAKEKMLLLLLGLLIRLRKKDSARSCEVQSCSRAFSTPQKG